MVINKNLSYYNYKLITSDKYEGNRTEPKQDNCVPADRPHCATLENQIVDNVTNLTPRSDFNPANQLKDISVENFLKVILSKRAGGYQ